MRLGVECADLKLPEKITNKLREVITTYQKKFDPMINVDDEIRKNKEYYKEEFCKFIKRDNPFSEKYVCLFNRFTNYEEFLRFMKSITLYNRSEELKCLSVEDRFLYLCIAIEAAMRFETERNGGATQDFINFFLKNLSCDTLKGISGKFKILSPAEDKLKEILPELFDDNEHTRYMKNAEMFFRYLYWCRSNIVHEGKFFEAPFIDENSTSTEVRDIFKYKKGKKEYVLHIEHKMTYSGFKRLYKEALLNKFLKSDAA